jgi:hypothetical protein
MSWLDAFFSAYIIRSDGTEQTSREALNFIGFSLTDDSVNNEIEINLPTGVTNQILQNNGSSYTATSNLTLPNGANRTISIADAQADSLTIRPSDGITSLDSGAELYIRPGEGAPGENNGELQLLDGEGGEVITIANIGAVGSASALSFFGGVPVIQQGPIADTTDSSGGSAGNTIGAVSGSGDDAQINDNFASLTAKVQALKDALENYRLLKEYLPP